MLTSLHVQNYALISALKIDFSGGLSVITGETGAGKSILIGALGLILGQRADTKSIKEGENKCLVEGIFDISSYKLKSFFDANDLEFDQKQCIIRREILSSGKSRAFVNDSPVGLNELKELGTKLIDIHSQHQNLQLSSGLFQLEVLDTMAGNKNLLYEYKNLYQTYKQAQSNLKTFQKEIDRKSQEEDYLRFQYQQLEEAKLKKGEQETLEAEIEILSNVEIIKSGLFKIEAHLMEDDNGILSKLKESLDTAFSISKILPSTKEIAERIQTAYLDLKDMLINISSEQERLEFKPERLQLANDRLDLIYSLQKKHKVDSELLLIELKESLSKKIEVIDNADQELEFLQNTLDKAQEELNSVAQKLNEARNKTAPTFEKMLVDKVSPLGMPNMKFMCQVLQVTQANESGMNEVNFIFSANKNAELKPIGEIASGGEISRLMIGIKALVAGAMALPTIIFDEIDTGVSGEIADKMGDIMHQLGEVMQVITITHLPQIAAKGNSHYFVYKQEIEDTTQTNIRRLSDDERIKEIAQMLSGVEMTASALQHAKNLLKL
ncbi:recombination and repair protein RecN [Bacteroidales bacterium]|nr:recombination and repair protein RecN [Bacteroidales bacterium]